MNEPPIKKAPPIKSAASEKPQIRPSVKSETISFNQEVSPQVQTDSSAVPASLTPSRSKTKSWIATGAALVALGMLTYFFKDNLTGRVKDFQTRAVDLPSSAEALGTASLSNIKQLSTGIMIYMSDYDDMLPLAVGFHDSVEPYVKNESIFRTEHPSNLEFEYNSRLSGYPSSAIESHDMTPLLRDVSEWADGHRLFAFVDAHAKFAKSTDENDLVMNRWLSDPRNPDQEDLSAVEFVPDRNVVDQHASLPETEQAQSSLRQDEAERNRITASSDAQASSQIIGGMPFKVPVKWNRDPVTTYRWTPDSRVSAFVRVLVEGPATEESIVALIQSEESRFERSSEYQYRGGEYFKDEEFDFIVYRWTFQLNRNNKGWMNREIIYTILDGRTVTLTTGVEVGYEVFQPEVDVFLNSISDW